MTAFAILQTTAASEEEANSLSEVLIDERLVACVQIFGPIRSRYRWQGKIEESEEWLCTAKTLVDRLPQVSERIRQVHSYDEPEIVATPIVFGSQGYLKWVRDSVAS